MPKTVIINGKKIKSKSQQDKSGLWTTKSKSVELLALELNCCRAIQSNAVQPIHLSRVKHLLKNETLIR